jgi:thioredoxin-like negative regulator of GroEL
MNEHVLVFFYTPSSDLCKEFYPEFLIAAAELKYVHNNDAVMAKVDANSTVGGQSLAAKYNVTEFPTLIWFVNGQPYPYDGSLNDRSDIVFWVVSKTDVFTRTLDEQVRPLLVASSSGTSRQAPFAHRKHAAIKRLFLSMKT